MNQRKGLSVSILCFFCIKFSAVLHITYAPSIQMIQQLLGSPGVYQFYDMRFLVRESTPPCYITSFWSIIHYHNLHLTFKGSCVTRGGEVNSIV